MTERAAAVWVANPKRYCRTTGEIRDEDAGWEADGTRPLPGAVRASYLVPNDPALIELLPTVHRFFAEVGVSGTTPPDGQRAEFTARAAWHYRALLRSFDEARRARLRNDGRGFLVAMSRSFTILQGTHRLAAEREAERAATDRAALAPPASRPAAKVYEKRFGFTVFAGLILLGCAGAVGLSLLPLGPTEEPLRVAGVVVFGGSGLLELLLLAQRRVTLRIDTEGVTLGGLPFRYRRTTKRLPWSGVRRVVLFRAAGLFPYVGVEPWTGAGVAKPLTMTDELTQMLAPHVPATVIQHSVQVQGWRLDRDRLVAAVKDFAPSVEIVELG